MGMFSNISNFVGKKITERDERRKEEIEIREIEHKALVEERKKQAPLRAKKLAEIETSNVLKDAKLGKTGGFSMGGIQNLAHGIGQSMGSQFNNDFDSMFSSPKAGGKKQSSGGFGMGGNAFDDEYEKMYGIPKKSTPHKKTSHHKKKKR